MTNWTNITTFEGLLQSANSYSPFWVGILFMMWVVLVISFMSYGINIAFLGGSFIAFFIGLLLAYMGLVSFKWVMGLLGIVIVLVLWNILYGKKGQ